ncbi:MAG: GIY-YIG nuclease family protein [Bacteroides xylanisolvens]
MSNYYVYRFKNKEGRVIYVGKTSLPLATRFNQHGHLPDKCYEQVERIEYRVQLSSETTVKKCIISIYIETISHITTDSTSQSPSKESRSTTGGMFM